MTFSDIIGLISLIVGVVGVVVGIIGCSNLAKANKLKVKELNGSTINQAETLIVHNGMDTFAVIKLARETTKEELSKLTDTLSATTLDLEKLRKEIDTIPRFYMGKERPENMKEGDIFFHVIEEFSNDGSHEI